MNNIDETVILKNIETINPYGLHPQALNGTFDSQTLALELISRWVPFFECHKCGRSDYCKYSVQHDINRNKFKDKRCGIVTETIKNFIAYSFEKLTNYSEKQQQYYFNGLYYLQKFVYQAELEIGLFIDKPQLDFYGHYVTENFGHIIYLRKYLNEIGNNFKNLSAFGSKKGLLFVEGKTEKVFLERMISNGYFSDKLLTIESYDGKSNKSNKKIKMLIDNYRRIGYEVFIQGDRDGSDIDFFQEHKKSGLISERHIFEFQQDFETSIPPPLFYLVLETLNLAKFSLQEFLEVIKNDDRSIVKILHEKFNLDLDYNKVIIGDSLGIILKPMHWKTNKEIKNSELVSFLQFVDGIYKEL